MSLCSGEARRYTPLLRGETAADWREIFRKSWSKCNDKYVFNKPRAIELHEARLQEDYEMWLEWREKFGVNKLLMDTSSNRHIIFTALQVSALIRVRSSVHSPLSFARPRTRTLAEAHREGGSRGQEVAEVRRGLSRLWSGPRGQRRHGGFVQVVARRRLGLRPPRRHGAIFPAPRAPVEPRQREARRAGAVALVPVDGCTRRTQYSAKS